MRWFHTRLIDSSISTAFGVFALGYGYRFRRVRSEEERQQHDQLVQNIFFESGIFDSADTPLAKEDEGAISVGFISKHSASNSPAGAVTVVSHPTTLPVQHFFHIEIPDNVPINQMAEITRFVVDSKHRQQPPIVTLGLLNQALTYSRKNGIRWWICCLPSFFIWTFQAFFRDCTVLEQLPLKTQQVETRKGRESYFAAERAIRVILVDTHSISMWHCLRLFSAKHRKSVSKRKRSRTNRRT